jgi:hypothetical protein
MIAISKERYDPEEIDPHRSPTNPHPATKFTRSLQSASRMILTYDPTIDDQMKEGALEKSAD